MLDMAAERIGDEIVKMLTEGDAQRSFELLDATGLLAGGAPGDRGACRASHSRRTITRRATSSTHTLLLLDQLPAGCAETLALGALLHDVAKPVTAERRADGRISFYGHPERGATTAVEIVPAAAAQPRRRGSASSTWCGTTSAWCRRRRCGSRP